MSRDLSDYRKEQAGCRLGTEPARQLGRRVQRPSEEVCVACGRTGEKAQVAKAEGAAGKGQGGNTAVARRLVTWDLAARTWTSDLGFHPRSDSESSEGFEQGSNRSCVF